MDIVGTVGGDPRASPPRHSAPRGWPPAPATRSITPGRPFSSALSAYPDGWADAIFLGCVLVSLAAARFLSPGLPLQLLTLTAVAAFGVVLAHRFRAGDHDLARATVRTRFWTRVAVEAPLVYALTRVLMSFLVPGLDIASFGRPVLWAGLGLAVSASLGAWLTCGLVRPWGEVFPAGCRGSRAGGCRSGRPWCPARSWR